MDGERRIYINEDHPLNSPGATKIYLNTGKSRKLNSPNDGTVIHLNTDKQADLGLHLNTTFSIASSKKIKLLFVLNFLLSLVCMVLCFSVACYYWHELSALRRQIDTMKDHLLNQNLNQDKIVQSPLVRHPRPQEERGSREVQPQFESSENAKTFFVEDLGDDLLFVDSRKKNESDGKHTKVVTTTTVQKDILIAQFYSPLKEHNMGSQYLIGPWTRDDEVSSKNSSDKIVLEQDHVVIKESGLYLVYAQVVYLTYAPNCYTIWARQTAQKPRLLALCATGDDSTRRPLDKSQISCAIQAIARLQVGDTVNISQRDANRTVLGGPGYSYFGFVKLNP